MLLGFAAACTIGILYPLDWIIGIRLAKNDELEGLDLTGIIRTCYLNMQKINGFDFILEHGENWEIEASRSIGDIVKKILEEQGKTREGEDAGTFELHYNPKNPNKNAYRIPLSKRKFSNNYDLDFDSLESNQVQNYLSQTASARESKDSRMNRF